MSVRQMHAYYWEIRVLLKQRPTLQYEQGRYTLLNQQQKVWLDTWKHRFDQMARPQLLIRNVP